MKLSIDIENPDPAYAGPLATVALLFEGNDEVQISLDEIRRLVVHLCNAIGSYHPEYWGPPAEDRPARTAQLQHMIQSLQYLTRTFEDAIEKDHP